MHLQTVTSVLPPPRPLLLQALCGVALVLGALGVAGLQVQLLGPVLIGGTSSTHPGAALVAAHLATQIARTVAAIVTWQALYRDRWWSRVVLPVTCGIWLVPTGRPTIVALLREWIVVLLLLGVLLHYLYRSSAARTYYAAISSAAEP